MKTFDCKPTLTDHLEANPEQQIDATPLLGEDWFVEGLLLNPETVGAVRSLLGANFGLSDRMSSHAGKCPDLNPLGWHVDGGNMHTFALNYLLVFCIPQDTTDEMGPTEIVPGSHFLQGQSALVDHYGAIKGTKKCTGPAGTVFITCYPLWHRRSKATAVCPTRQLLKYNYFRKTAPKRDWIIEPDFDPGRDTHQFNLLRTGAPVLRRNFLDSYDAARMFMWLCGHEDEFRYIGGIAWPGPTSRENGATPEPYAVPPSLRSHPVDYEPEATPMSSRG